MTTLPPADCHDNSSICDDWTAAGFCCGEHAQVMKETCPKSCGHCGTASTTTSAPPANWPNRSFQRTNLTGLSILFTNV